MLAYVQDYCIHCDILVTCILGITTTPAGKPDIFKLAVARGWCLIKIGPIDLKQPEVGDFNKHAAMDSRASCFRRRDVF
jgi:hypothetical protein